VSYSYGYDEIYLLTDASDCALETRVIDAFQSHRQLYRVGANGTARLKAVLKALGEA
jgi:hypothetical protein